MVESRRDLDLAEEPLRPKRRGELGMEDLEHHQAIVLEVLGQVDGRHASTTDFPLNDVAVGQGRL